MCFGAFGQEGLKDGCVEDSGDESKVSGGSPMKMCALPSEEETLGSPGRRGFGGHGRGSLGRKHGRGQDVPQEPVLEEPESRNSLGVWRSGDPRPEMGSV